MPDVALFSHASPDLFRQAVLSTAQAEGFNPLLVEKDYYCSLVLADLQHIQQADGPGIVFKGGTCLAKAYLGFYRLSEDLDFAIAVDEGTTRAQRSRLAGPWKDWVQNLPGRVPGLRVSHSLAGHSNSTQYVAEVEYDSVRDGAPGRIKIEIALREPLLLPAEKRPLQTLLRDPLNRQPVMSEITIAVLSLREACAEKVRAALSRREPAVRDFFDLDHIMAAGIVDPASPEMLRLVRSKLSVPGNDAPDLSESRLAAVHAQVESQLRPVLRARDFGRFDLQRSVALLRRIVAALETASAGINPG
jgi:predicted nucleotidyltransferase component of viral defense system